MSRFAELAAAAAQRAGTLGGMVESIYLSRFEAPPIDPRSLLTVVPHARFVAFERCGHFPDLEDPRRFAELLLDGWEHA